jgi:hypothetical protein
MSLATEINLMKTDQNAIDKKLDTTVKHSIQVHNLVKENYQDLLEKGKKLAQNDNKLQSSINNLEVHSSILGKNVEKLTCDQNCLKKTLK